MHPDLLSVLSRHTNVRQVYSGHYHRGLVWGPLYAFPFTTLPAVRYDSDNFFLLHLARDGSRHECVTTGSTWCCVVNMHGQQDYRLGQEQWRCALLAHLELPRDAEACQGC